MPIHTAFQPVWSTIIVLTGFFVASIVPIWILNLSQCEEVQNQKNVYDAGDPKNPVNKVLPLIFALSLFFAVAPTVGWLFVKNFRYHDDRLRNFLKKCLVMLVLNIISMLIVIMYLSLQISMFNKLDFFWGLRWTVALFNQSDQKSGVELYESMINGTYNEKMYPNQTFNCHVRSHEIINLLLIALFFYLWTMIVYRLRQFVKFFLVFGGVYREYRFFCITFTIGSPRNIQQSQWFTSDRRTQTTYDVETSEMLKQEDDVEAQEVDLESGQEKRTTIDSYEVVSEESENEINVKKRPLDVFDDYLEAGMQPDLREEASSMETSDTDSKYSKENEEDEDGLQMTRL